MRIFVVQVYGLYGGQWYCAVYANSDKEAFAIAREKYPIDENNWKDYEQGGLNLPSTQYAKVELVFTNGISNLWWVSW